MAATCPCSSGLSHTKCCGPYLKGKAQAPTAEALMRSRYCAYTMAEVDYIVATTLAGKREEVELDETRKWAEESDWKSLEICQTVAGGPDDEEGLVEFIATYITADGEEVNHHERSLFQKEEGIWYFVDGEPAKQQPVVRDGEKVGRNDPCPCGSGKKHKKCCG